MSEDLREDIDSFFGELKEKFGLAGEEPTPTDDEKVASSAGTLRLTPTPPEERPEAAPPAPAVPDPAATAVDSEEDLLYPGSKNVRRGLKEQEQAPEPEADPVWDERPRVYTVKGAEKEFFTISALAHALRREPVSMRKWEEKGYLPSARYRAPGKGKKRDRLYTRAQIEGLVKIAKAEGLMDPAKKKRIDQTGFPDKAHRLFDDLMTKGN